MSGRTSTTHTYLTQNSQHVRRSRASTTILHDRRCGLLQPAVSLKRPRSLIFSSGNRRRVSLRSALFGASLPSWSPWQTLQSARPHSHDASQSFPSSSHRYNACHSDPLSPKTPFVKERKKPTVRSKAVFLFCFVFVFLKRKEPRKHSMAIFFFFFFFFFFCYFNNYHSFHDCVLCEE